MAGVQPLANALPDAIRAREVRLCLQPLQGGLKRKSETLESAEPKNNEKSPGSSSNKATAETERLRGQVENLQNQLKNIGRGCRGKGGLSLSSAYGVKSKGKAKSRIIRTTPALIGLSPTSDDGEPNCFDFHSASSVTVGPGATRGPMAARHSHRGGVPRSTM